MLNAIFMSAVLTLYAPAAPVTPEETKEQVCESYAGLAYSIMATRQAGASLDVMLKVRGVREDPLARMLITQAFHRPLALTDEAKEGLNREYSSQVLLACLEGDW